TRHVLPERKLEASIICVDRSRAQAKHRQCTTYNIVFSPASHPPIGSLRCAQSQGVRFRTSVLYKSASFRKAPFRHFPKVAESSTSHRQSHRRRKECRVYIDLCSNARGREHRYG